MVHVSFDRVSEFVPPGSRKPLSGGRLIEKIKKIQIILLKYIIEQLKK